MIKVIDGPQQAKRKDQGVEPDPAEKVLHEDENEPVDRHLQGHNGEVWILDWESLLDPDQEHGQENQKK